MAYIGKVPSAVPITSADLADSIVTSAKIADGTITLSDLSATGTQDATTFLRGDNTFAEAGGGKVLQVIQTVKSDTFSHTGTTYTDVTGLSASITPSSASNKILVMVDLMGAGGLDTNHIFARLLRDSTVIYAGDTAGSRTLGFYTGIVSNNSSCEFGSGTYLDSPSTTSATTYKIQIRVNDGSTLYMNRTYADADNASHLRGVSQITLMEISA
jgi:hypothetical protein